MGLLLCLADASRVAEMHQASNHDNKSPISEVLHCTFPHGQDND